LKGAGKHAFLLLLEIEELPEQVKQVVEISDGKKLLRA